VAVRTVLKFALIPFPTFFSFVVHGMIFYLLPAMTKPTIYALLAAGLVVLQGMGSGVPVGTYFIRVDYFIWVPSIVLPVVSINTHVSVMIFVIERAKNSFEEIHVEVAVVVHFVE
jgi:hypothetical protein